MKRKRYVIVGAGGRATCFARALIVDYRECADLVALCDVNLLRLRGFNEYLETQIPMFTDFGEMVAKSAPTHAIICSPDYTHAAMIEQAFQHGLEAVCEKPMATDAAKVRQILALEKQYGKKVAVTFNYRYHPYSAQIKRVLQEGRLGAIRSINFEWLLDKVHGGEYFRRWHASMAHSGGLFVHKATHHFDLVNWFIGSEPASVAAFGSLNVFGAKGPFRGERCSTCRYAGGQCAWEMKIHTVPQHKRIFEKLYWEPEAGDGYVRDRCLFREEIDIYDSMNAIVSYRNGTQLSYSLTAYAPVEGYRLSMIGTEARLEASTVNANTMDAGIMQDGGTGEDMLVVTRGHTREDLAVEQIAVSRQPGAHGGGDKRMFEHLFGDNVPDPLGQAAGSSAGAMSCLIGIAANQAVAENRVVSINELFLNGAENNAWRIEK